MRATGEFSVSDPGDENLQGNLFDPQFALEPLPHAPPRAPLAEIALPQLQPQRSETTAKKTQQAGQIAFVTVADYHDPLNPRWISSDPYTTGKFALGEGFLSVSFNREAKPVLPRTYIEFERRHHDLCVRALQWVVKYFTPELNTPNMTRAEVMRFGEENPLLVRWIDRVANANCFCWLDVLHEQRHLIAMAVLGKVLEDRVFKDEFFGAPEEEKKVLRAIDQVLGLKEVQEIKDRRSRFFSDAFTRQKPRATYINQSHNHNYELPKQFPAHVDRLFDQLVELLRPLLPTNEKQFPPQDYYTQLVWIVALAGKLSLDMRREPDTVYYVAITPPRYKGLDPERMSPVVFRDEEKEHIARHSEKYTNVISVWPGVVAYRRLSDKRASFRTIRRSLIYTSDKDDGKFPIRIDWAWERTLSEPQLWQYLRHLGVSISKNGRAQYG